MSAPAAGRVASEVASTEWEAGRVCGRSSRIMGWRNTGSFNAPQEVRVLTCDVCECDIGHEDGRRPRPHFEVNLLPNAGAMDQQNPPAVLCSRECLRAFASRTGGPDRAPPVVRDPRETGKGRS